jgi:hypothetical protein
VYTVEVMEHRQWLRGEGEDRLERWEDLLSQNRESAICEAVLRVFLVAQGASVESWEDPSIGGPDFLCTAENQEFFVEVTCVTTDKVTSKSHLSDEPHGACHYGLLTNVFRGELSSKTSQCSGLNHPCLIAIATLHRQGGVKCFGEHAIEDLLTGTGKITMEYDAARGEGVGAPYESTSLQDSAFIRFGTNRDKNVEFARNPVSGVLLCAFGYADPQVVGAPHPNPNHNFDRVLLPRVRLAKLADRCLETGELIVEWV